MSEFKSSNFSNEDNSGGPDLVGITTFTSTAYFVPPSGNTAQRPSGDGLAYGTLRFNTDIGRLEVWRGDHWATILGESPNLGGGTGSNTGTGARALIGGGQGTPGSNVIDFFTIPTLGNAQDFGDLTEGRRWSAACASSTRGIWGGGETGPSDRIDFVNFASTGNATSNFCHASLFNTKSLLIFVVRTEKGCSKLKKKETSYPGSEKNEFVYSANLKFRQDGYYRKYE